MFSITDSEEKVPFYCVTVGFFWIEREEMRGEHSGFYQWVDKPWPWTKITKAFHLLRAPRMSCELDPTCLCSLVSG